MPSHGPTCARLRIGSQLSTVWMAARPGAPSPSLTRPLLTRFGAPGQAIDERSGGGEEGQSDAEAITGMRSPNGILLFLLVLTAVLLLLFIVGGVVGLRRIAGVPTIRLSRTGQRPELSLHRGVLWHLFNSHIWSTGQDAAAAIKKELQLLLPGINVFLDARAHRITAPLKRDRAQDAPRAHRWTISKILGRSRRTSASRSSSSASSAAGTSGPRTVSARFARPSTKACAHSPRAGTHGAPSAERNGLASAHQARRSCSCRRRTQLRAAARCPSCAPSARSRRWRRASSAAGTRTSSGSASRSSGWSRSRRSREPCCCIRPTTRASPGCRSTSRASCSKRRWRSRARRASAPCR